MENGTILLVGTWVHPLSVEGSASGAAFPMAQQRSDAARVPATPGGDA